MRIFLFLAGSLLPLACSSSPTPGASGSGGTAASGGAQGQTGGSSSGGRGTGGSASGEATASGGVTASGGMPASGGVTGSGGMSASGGTPGSGGTAGRSATSTGGGGGAASGGSSAAGGGSPAGGSGGTSAGGNGGRAGGAGTGGPSDGGVTDPKTAAQVLDGFALLKPCFSPPGSCAGCTCDENSASLLSSGAAPENQHITRQFGGDANVTYAVKLRVVGVAERYWYSGGTLDSTSKVFYTGGLPTIHSTQVPNQNLRPGQGACKIHPPDTDKDYPIPFTVPPEVAPADNCYNGFNIFGMTVSSPKQTYFFNYTADVDTDRQPHAVYKTDYTVTVPIAGQAKIDFYVIDGDHHEVANTTMTVPNVKSTDIKQPYSGNFLELQVTDVTVSN